MDPYYHFVLAREGEKKYRSSVRSKQQLSEEEACPTGVGSCGELPGLPIAILATRIHKNLAGMYLCAVRDEERPRLERHEVRSQMEFCLQEAKKARLDLLREGKADTTLQTAIENARRSVVTRSLKDRDDADESESEPDESESGDVVCAAGSKRPREDEVAAVCASGPVRVEFKQVLSISFPYDVSLIQLPPFVTSDPFGKKEIRRLVTLIGAKPGAGKTVKAAQLTRTYHSLFPTHRIWGFCQTRMKDDEAWDGIPLEQKSLDFFKSKPAEEFFNAANPTLLIADDYDSIADKADQAWFISFLTIVCNIGRKQRVSLIVTTHELANFKQTSAITKAAEYVTVFPGHTIGGELEYFLCKKLGISRWIYHEIAAEERWVTFRMIAPYVCFTSTKAYIVPPLDPSKTRKKILAAD